MENDNIRTRIGSELRALRNAKGLSVRGLSELIGVNSTNISAIENGRYNARLDTIEKFESFFGVTFGLVRKK